MVCMTDKLDIDTKVYNHNHNAQGEIKAQTASMVSPLYRDVHCFVGELAWQRRQTSIVFAKATVSQQQWSGEEASVGCNEWTTDDRARTLAPHTHARANSHTSIAVCPHSGYCCCCFCCCCCWYCCRFCKDR